MDLPMLVITISVVLILVIILVVVLIKQSREGSFPLESRVGSQFMGRGIAIGYAIGMGRDWP